MSIATELTRLNTNKEALATAKTAIASAITDKGGTVASGDGFADFATDIASIPSGGETQEAPENDVIFIDYDGKILYSYSAEEFLALTEMPANPTHEGLTAQGWNWTLADAKAYVAECGMHCIGQSYITDDGHTRIYLSIPYDSVTLELGLNISGSISVDWGDGMSETVTSSSGTKYTPHTYQNKGDYVISFSVTGSVLIIGVSNTSVLISKHSATANQNCFYQSLVRKIELGSKVSTGDSAFKNLVSLECVVRPIGLTYNQYEFSGNRSLKTNIVPSGGTGMQGLPNGCTGVRYVSVPKTISTTGTGEYYGCSRLLRHCISGTYTATGDSEFQNCDSLNRVSIPTTIAKITQFTFLNCISLYSVVIPASVTEIGNSAFYGCASLHRITFKMDTPPTVSNVDAWNGVPTDCEIHVPSGTLNAYKTATNYPDPSTYTYVEDL